MSLHNGPPRPGARGGADQFSWENVKSDKDREYYLGHSLKATTGRWQKNKDVFWWTREKGDDREHQLAEELARVKAREEELMLEAMGLKPKAVAEKIAPKLDTRDMKQLMEGGPEEEDEEPDAAAEADRVKGLGYSVGEVIGSGDAGREVMAGVGIGPDQTQQGRSGAALPPPPKLTAAQLKVLLKRQKKEVKEARRRDRKANKAAKKAAKKAKKEKARQASPSGDDSSSGSDIEEIAGKRPRHDSPDEGNPAPPSRRQRHDSLSPVRDRRSPERRRRADSPPPERRHHADRERRDRGRERSDRVRKEEEGHRSRARQRHDSRSP